MWKSFANALLLLVVTTAAARATGIYTPNRWLEYGGVAAGASPEFMWDVEVRRLAKAESVKEKRVTLDDVTKSLTKDEPQPGSGEVDASFLSRLMDQRDFAAAMKRGKPDDDAFKNHRAARDAIEATNEATVVTLPNEADSEFADYHRGAHEFHQGEKHWDNAVAAWQKLLQRPSEQRHYRTIWATFMLGKVALFRQQAEAVTLFQKTRALAAEGFADSLGLAAESYGWEAQSELKAGNFEKSAQLYLTQLALGDLSAIVSLKSFVVGSAHAEPTASMERNARDPLLRQLQSAYVLATETWGYGGWWGGATNGEQCKAWLATIAKAGLTDIDDAARLGWAAYNVGDYEQATHWLKLNKTTSPVSLWLEAKLARRKGDLDAASRKMADVVRAISGEPDTYAPVKAETNFVFWSDGFSFPQSAAGDYASLQLTRGDFVDAFAAFLKADLKTDAAFMAERVLTLDELIDYVTKHTTAEREDVRDRWARDSNPLALRWLLARRCVREDRYDVALRFMPDEYKEPLQRYLASLKKADDARQSKRDRARAYWDAAEIARFNGMEIMGTEVEPDGLDSGGSFEPSNVAAERLSGQAAKLGYESNPDGTQKITTVPLTVPASKAERERLAKNHPVPDKRFHYRYIAAALAFKAAALLPDNSDELADVLNSAGTWIKKDDQAADKYFQAIERRASKTEVGKQAGKAHWFVEHYGPWSSPPKDP